MGHKINLNINNEWEPQVRPILEEWKDEGGDFSGKVCEAIVFRKQATTEHIWEAITAYDQYKEFLKADEPTTLQQWELITCGNILEGRNPIHYLTKAAGGPLLTPAKARAEVIRLRKVAEELGLEGLMKIKKHGELIETPFERLLRKQSPFRVSWGTGDLEKAAPEEAYDTLERLKSFVRGLEAVVDENKERVERYKKLKEEERKRKSAEWLAQQQAARAGASTT